MLLIHKPHHPTSPSLMSPIKLSQQHRRNPSAPAAVVNVLPTKTPGLLSLSRPVQRTAQQHTQLPRIATPRQHRARPAPVVNTLVQQVQTTALSPAPSPEKARGRSHPSRDKPARNSSKPRPANAHGRNNRQPSPSPIVFPNQTQDLELTSSTPPAPTTTATATTTTTDAPSKSVSTPALAVPSGRLAKRRNRLSTPNPASHARTQSQPDIFSKLASGNNANQHNENTDKGRRTPSPVKSRPRGVPVPIPILKNAHNNNSEIQLSRSDPVLSHFADQKKVKGGVEVFPICDDTDSLAGHLSDNEIELPVTPIRANVGVTWQQQKHTQPRPKAAALFFNSDSSDVDDTLAMSTMPKTPVGSPTVTTRGGYFPPLGSPIASSSPKRNRSRPPVSPTMPRALASAHGTLPRTPTRPSHAHVRAPSHPSPSARDMLFNMSSMDATSNSENELSNLSVQSADMRALFGVGTPVAGKNRNASPARVAALLKAEADLAYANSKFQNSPSPDSLPPPPTFTFAAFSSALQAAAAHASTTTTSSL